MPRTVRRPAVASQDLVPNPETRHQPLDIPPNLAEWRDFFFDPGPETTCTNEEWTNYFGYVSNVYSRHRSKIRNDGATIERWRCRLQREKATGDGSACHCWLIAVFYEDEVEIRCYNSEDPEGNRSERHEHDLARMDQLKRNDILRQICMEQVMAGRGPAEVLASLQNSDQQGLEAAGGRHLSLRDITNWGREIKASRTQSTS